MNAHHNSSRVLSPPAPSILHSCRKSGSILSVAILVLALLVPGYALSVRQLNLQELCSRADRIMRVTVLDVNASSIEAGGGKIPITIYRLQVKESLNGADAGVVDIKIVGSLKKPEAQGNVRRLDPLDSIPRLERGHEYLLFTTPASRIGLVSFVGLGQGCFSIYSQDKQVYAVNAASNAGLGLDQSGPALYSDLARRIRQLRNP